MNDPDGFDDLAREFQTVDVAEREQVRDRIVRARRRIAGSFVSGGAIAVGLFALALRKLWIERDAPAIAFAVIEIGVPVVLLRYMWREQRKLWHATATTTRGFLEFEVARTSAEIRQSTFLFRVTPVLVAGIIVFQALVLRKDPSVFVHAPLPGTIGLVGPYAILACVLAYTWKKKARLERERAALEGDVRSLTAEGAPPSTVPRAD